MAIEIERKFLINETLWKRVKPQKVLYIKQAYLSSDGNTTLRVRIANDKSYITIKGKTTNLTRPEFEYEIPLVDAEELMQLSISSIIEKKRHIVYYKGKKWEVDEFLNENEGLFIAEIELNSEKEKFDFPEWIHKEVSNDPHYRNTYLAKSPFSTWEKQ